MATQTLTRHSLVSGSLALAGIDNLLVRPGGGKPSDVQLGNLAHHCVYYTYASLTRFFNSRKSRQIGHDLAENGLETELQSR